MNPHYFVIDLIIGSITLNKCDMLLDTKILFKIIFLLYVYVYIYICINTHLYTYICLSVGMLLMRFQGVVFLPSWAIFYAVFLK